jgi:hypothetical protein
MATLFGIIVSLDALERAYVRESVSEAQYAPACTRLLAQYKTISKLVITSDGHDGGVNAMPGIPVVKDVQDFMTQFKVSVSPYLEKSYVASTLIPALQPQLSLDGSCCGLVSHSSRCARYSRACICFVFSIELRKSKMGGRNNTRIHHLHGCSQVEATSQGSTPSSTE